MLNLKNVTIQSRKTSFLESGTTKNLSFSLNADLIERIGGNSKTTVIWTREDWINVQIPRNAFISLLGDNGVNIVDVPTKD